MGAKVCETKLKKPRPPQSGNDGKIRQPKSRRNGKFEGSRWRCFSLDGHEFISRSRSRLRSRSTSRHGPTGNNAVSQQADKKKEMNKKVDKQVSWIAIAASPIAPHTHMATPHNA